MPIAILGDIHSNVAALKAVLQKIDEYGIRRIFFVGDLVGYNASPSECIHLLSQQNIESISGNHDRYTTGQAMRDVRETTIEAVEYTREAIGEHGLSFLRALPDQKMVDDKYLLVHGSIRDRDEYMLSSEVILENLRKLRIDYNGIEICFFGHSHFPAVIGNGHVDMKFPETRTVKLKPTKQYMINPGSVGQPRDRVPLASFAVYDPRASHVEIIRVEYDVQDTVDRILKAGLGRSLADRLVVGR